MPQLARQIIDLRCWCQWCRITGGVTCCRRNRRFTGERIGQVQRTFGAATRQKPQHQQHCQCCKSM